VQDHALYGKLYTPEHPAQKPPDVLAGLTPEHSGERFTRNGGEIPP